MHIAHTQNALRCLFRHVCAILIANFTFQIIMGALNLGFIALFLSDPLVAGYTTGAALFVFTAQVKYFFGINLHRHQAPFALVKVDSSNTCKLLGFKSMQHSKSRPDETLIHSVYCIASTKLFYNLQLQISCPRLTLSSSPA